MKHTFLGKVEKIKKNSQTLKNSEKRGKSEIGRNWLWGMDATGTVHTLCSVSNFKHNIGLMVHAWFPRQGI